MIFSKWSLSFGCLMCWSGYVSEEPTSHYSLVPPYLLSGPELHLSHTYRVSGDPGFWRSRFLEIQVSGSPGFSPTPTEAPPLLQSDSPLPQSGSPASATERHACLRSPDLTSPLVSSPPGFSTWILHLDFSSLSSSFLPSLYLPPTGE